MKTEFWINGKTSQKYIQEGIDIYSKRISSFIPFEIKELKSVKSIGSDEIKKTESENVLQILKPDDKLILLDEKGKTFTSQGFSAYVQKQFNNTGSRLIFLSGGAFGFSKSLYDRSQDLISLSEMTFPHELVRVIFLEQFYRALTILQNHPYQHY